MNVSAMNSPVSSTLPSDEAVSPAAKEQSASGSMAAAAADHTSTTTTTTTSAADDPWAVDTKPSESSAAAAANGKDPASDPSSTTDKSKDLPSPEAEEDEEVRIAMEMALAAAQNPKMSAAQLRKLVAQKNKQMAIVDEIETKKRAEEWNKKKERVTNWWHGTAERVTESVLELRESAGQAVEEYQDRAERRKYAEQIRSDPQYNETRRKMKIAEKTLKAHRLQGNRVETRHAFKRQRDEKKLMELNKKLDKTHKLFIESSYNVHEYAKAMMRASKKWKKVGSDEELTLEAQLCRNMHQMLAIEKQKSKVKKTSREIKKYLQRCKGWLSDKKALCEMHMMTLDATNACFVDLYEDTLKRQDALIAKLLKSDEFKGVDIDSVELDNWKQLNEKKIPGPYATLSALRGLPINDSIRIKKEQLGLPPDDMRKGPPGDVHPEFKPEGGRPELYIETGDDASVHSQLSDPDGDEDHQESLHLENSSSSVDFGQEAPWNASSQELESTSEKDTEDDKKAAAAAAGQQSKPKPSKPADTPKKDLSKSKTSRSKDESAKENSRRSPEGKNGTTTKTPSPENKANGTKPSSSAEGKISSTSHSAASASSNLEFSDNSSLPLAGDEILTKFTNDMKSHNQISEFDDNDNNKTNMLNNNNIISNNNSGYFSDASPTTEDPASSSSANED